MLSRIFSGDILLKFQDRKDESPTTKSDYRSGFYWAKFRPGGRWEPVEFDGIAWMSEESDGSDIYLLGPRIMEPVH